MKKIVVCLLIVFVAIALCSCSIFDTETDSESSIEGIVGKSVQIAFMDIYCTANSVSECQKDDDSYRLCINITADNKDEAQTFYASSFSLEDADGTTFVSNPLEIYVKSNETKTFNVYFDINRKIDRTKSLLRIKLGLFNIASIKLKNENNSCVIESVDKIDIPNEKIYSIGETATGSDNISYTVTKSFNCKTLPQKSTSTEYNFLIIVFQIYNGRNSEFALSPEDVCVFNGENKYSYSSKTFLYSDGLSITESVMAKTSRTFSIIFETPTSSDVEEYVVRFPVDYGDYSGAYNYIYFKI